MPRNSNGVYILPAGNPVISGTVIESEWANSTMEDIAEALTWSLDRRGFGGMTVPLYFADGTEAAPGAAWDNEKSTGFYRAELGDIRVSVLGQDLFRWWQGDAYIWDAVNEIWQRVVASNNIDVDTDGNVTFNENVTVEGDTTVDGDLTVGGDLIVGGENINTIVNALNATGALNRPYRYWRMDEIEKQEFAGSLRLNEIKLELGNVEVQTNAVISTTPSFGLDERLNDGLTDLTVGVTGLEQVVWDFGEGTPQALDTIYQWPDGSGVSALNGIQSFRLSASDNGTDWIVLAVFSDLNPVPDEYSSGYRIFNLGEAPADGEVYARQDRAWVPVGGGLFTFDYTVKTSGFTAEKGKWHFVDNSAGSFTIVPPASPAPGDVFGVSVAYVPSTSESVYPVYINFSSTTFGKSGNMEVVLYNGFLTFGELDTLTYNTASFIYVDATIGWAPLWGLGAGVPYQLVE